MTSNRLSAALAAAMLVLAAGGCDEESTTGCAQDLAADLTLPTLAIAATGGFDDFGSAGAAFGYAVDSTNDVTVVAIMKFSLPGAQYSFTPSCDAASSAASVAVVSAAAPSGVDEASWPILRAALTDTAGIRALASASTAGVFVLLEGDPTLATPTRILVADAGDVTLSRLDGPSDVVEAFNLQFREVDGLGAGAQLSGGRVVKVESLVFDWPTPGMPVY